MGGQPLTDARHRGLSRPLLTCPRPQAAEAFLYQVQRKQGEAVPVPCGHVRGCPTRVTQSLCIGSSLPQGGHTEFRSTLCMVPFEATVGRGPTPAEAQPICLLAPWGVTILSK